MSRSKTNLVANRLVEIAPFGCQDVYLFLLGHYGAFQTLEIAFQRSNLVFDEEHRDAGKDREHRPKHSCSPYHAASPADFSDHDGAAVRSAERSRAERARGLILTSVALGTTGARCSNRKVGSSGLSSDGGA